MGTLYMLSFKNGKHYIGITNGDVMRRMHAHRASVKDSNFLLYKAWRKHGEPSLSVLAIIENSILHRIEIKAIAAFGTLAPGGYNLTRGGQGTLGYALSLEHRAKIGAANRLKGLGRTASKETREKMSNSAKGRTFSVEHRNNLRIAAMNMSDETRRKIGLAHKGKTISDEHRSKLRELYLGKRLSPETIEKLRVAHSKPEYRLHMSMVKKGMTQSAETRAKKSATMKKHWAKKKETCTI